MADVIDRTLHLTRPGTFVAGASNGLVVNAPNLPAGPPGVEATSAGSSAGRVEAVPIEQLDSVCVFDPTITFSPGAQELCLERGVAVNFFREYGRLLARFTGVADRSAPVRRLQYRAADDPTVAANLARSFIAGKLQNYRQLLVRTAAGTANPQILPRLHAGCGQLARHLKDLDRLTPAAFASAGIFQTLRGVEVAATETYFSVFGGLLPVSVEGFSFLGRSRRSPRDRVNSLLNFVYGMVRQDCAAALSAMGLDPTVGFLHSERPNRPALALDLMEEFRPWLADQLVIDLIGRRQLGSPHFNTDSTGVVELSDFGAELVVAAYQKRKQETLRHPLFAREFQIGQLPVLQACTLVRYFQGELSKYTPLVP